MICFLIDDDHDDQEIFELALKDVDPSYECIMARDCFDALTILKADEHMHIDFIFLDINMPKMTGKECVIELKKDPRLENIPTFLYSTHDSGKELEDARNLGATGFITKPPSIPELTTLLRDIIEAHVKRA